MYRTLLGVSIEGKAIPNYKGCIERCTSTKAMA